jgi:hypothetical protein
MARGRQLSQLLNQLQAEAGMSLLPASSVSSRDSRVQLLNRVQARLYAAYDWDFVYIKRDVLMPINTRYATLPVDIDFDRVNQANISQGTNSNEWRGLGYGIGDGDYRQTGEGEKGCPQKWAPTEGGLYEVWPVPDGTYRIRFRGVKVLPPMVNDSDRAVLDDTLIVLHAASELMKRAKLLDWEDKLRDGQAHFMRLRSFSGGNKRASFIMGGGISGLPGDYQTRPVRGLDYMT